MAFERRKNLFDLRDAAIFLGVRPGEFAILIREGKDIPECQHQHDLELVRFTRASLERWKLEHTIGSPCA